PAQSSVSNRWRLAFARLREYGGFLVVAATKASTSFPSYRLIAVNHFALDEPCLYSGAFSILIFMVASLMNALDRYPDSGWIARGWYSKAYAHARRGATWLGRMKRKLT